MDLHNARYDSAAIKELGYEDNHYNLVLFPTISVSNFDVNSPSKPKFVNNILTSLLKHYTIITTCVPNNLPTTYTSNISVAQKNIMFVFNIIIKLLCCEVLLSTNEQLQLIHTILANMGKSTCDIDFEIVKHESNVGIKALFTPTNSSTTTYHLYSISFEHILNPTTYLIQNTRLIALNFNNLFHNDLRHLITLQLSRNFLSDEFLITFSLMLYKNNILQKLYLADNKFTDIGISTLSSAFYYNHSLTHLDISNNVFGADGLYAVTTSLRYNPSLVFLNVSTYPWQNKISQQHLAKALLFLQYNQKIKALHCWNHGNETLLHKTFNVIISFNQTLYRLNNHFKNAHKAKFFGLRRRQHIFAWYRDCSRTN